MSYIINGPTTIGDTGQLNEILGDVRLTDITSAFGDIVYADTSNNLARLAPGTSGQILQTNGVGAAPSWVSSATNIVGFSARKTGTQGGITTTATAITTWSTATAPEYDNTGGDFNGTTGVFTAPANGTWLLQANVSFTTTSNAGSRSVSVFIDDGVTPTAEYTYTFQPTGNVALSTNVPITVQIALTSTYDVTLRASTTNGTLTVDATPQTWWGMSRLT